MKKLTLSLFLLASLLFQTNATVVFDPATYDESNLQDNMEIVVIGIDTLLKITTDNWTNFLTLDSTIHFGEDNNITFKIMIDPGTSGLSSEELHFYLGGFYPEYVYKENEIFTGGDSAYNVLTEVNITVPEGKSLNVLQFAVQETENWSAVNGAIYYIGKITSNKIVYPYVFPPTTLNVHPTNGSNVTLDGLMLEDAWASSDLEFVSNPISFVEGYPASNADNSAGWYALYDSENLYLYIDITDDVIVPMSDPEASSAQPWMNDGFELFFDVKDRRFDGDRISSEQHQLRFNVDRTSADMDALGVYTATWNQVKSSDSYQFELAIPWAGICQGAIDDDAIADYIADSIIPGKTIAFELSVIDADEENGRKSILNWANNTGEDMAYYTTLYWGELTLVDEDELTLRPLKEEIIIPQNVSFSYQIEYYGEGEFSFSSSPETDWLTIDENGLLSGTPTEEGTYSITVIFSDSESTTNQTYTITVNPYEAVKITSVPVEAAKVGELYEYQLSFEGEGSFSLNSTPEAEWLTIDESGMLSGTPSVAASYDVQISLVDTYSTFYQSFTLSVSDAHTGISKTNIPEIEIYPNPTTGILYLNTNSEIQNVRVFDLVGNTVYETSSIGADNNIDLSSLNGSIFFVQIKTLTNTKTIRVLKK